MNHEAVYQLYPQARYISNEVVYDENDHIVEIDLSAVQTKANELQSAEAQAQQAAETHKQNAISKLSALGLSADEIAALGVK